MFAVFKGSNAEGQTSGLDAHESLDRAHQHATARQGGNTGAHHATVEAAAEAAGTAPGSSDSRGGLQRFVLQGAAFGHWPACADVSWASITTPESGQRVHLALCGEIENEAEIAELYNIREEHPSELCTFTSSGAKLLLDLYWKGFSDAYGDYSAQPETCLASLEGAWSFCLFDESSGYILAAASAQGSPATTLFWASCPTTGDISVTTAGLVDLLDRSTVSEFPRGSFYVKSLCNPEGEMASFVPRGAEMDLDTETSNLCSTVFRVASGSDIAGLHSGTDVQAQ